MTYPPNNPGYQVPQQPAGYGAPPGRAGGASGPNRFLAYLEMARCSGWVCSPTWRVSDHN